VSEIVAAEDIAMPPLNARIRYDLMHTMMEDYRSIQRRVASYVVDYPGQITEQVRLILTTPFPYYQYGKYPIRIKYTIPGTDKTSSYDWDFFNEIRN
jgi:hypothetical protein